LEVPKYPDGQVGTLWALFYPKGEVEVVSSEFAPGHPKWPGRVKGWPKPSLEYRRKVWQEEYDQLLAEAKGFERMVTNPTGEDLRRAWLDDKERNPEAIKGLSGPNDASYVKSLKASFVGVLATTRAQIKDMESRKP
jgi:hypothetical protein